jgi:hypothetical protein
MKAIHIQGEHNITFVHIPKNGGISIGNWLEESKGDSESVFWTHHPSCKSIHEMRTPNFTFAVVRNPWDRIVSGYHFLKDDTGTGLKDVEVYRSVINFIHRFPAGDFPDFETFVKALGTKDLNRLKIVAPILKQSKVWFNYNTPQVAWLDSKVDLILRYENLEEEFDQIRKMFNSDKPLPKINVSLHAHYRTYYTEETKNLVAEWFEQDIKAFGYTF